MLRATADADLTAARAVAEELAADLRSSDLVAAQEAASAKAAHDDLQRQVRQQSVGRCLRILLHAHIFSAAASAKPDIVETRRHADAQIAALLAEGVAKSEELLRLTTQHRALTQHDAHLEVRHHMSALFLRKSGGVRSSVLSQWLYTVAARHPARVFP